jgi:uncharacterized protein YqeY
MSLKDKLMEDLKQAVRQGDERRRSTLRLVIAAIKNAEIEKRHELDEGELLAVIAKEAKQRRESIAEFETGGRQDLVDQEKAELQVLLAYLPEQLSREEIEAKARQTIEEVGATGPAQMGEVMRRLMPLMKGRADGKLVSQVVKELLAGKT